MHTTDIPATPQEGWFLFRHYTGHHLLLIDVYAQSFRTARTTEVRKASIRTIEAVRGQLIKYLEGLREQMKEAGHSEATTRMQTFIDMFEHADLLDKKQNKEVLQTFKELCR